MYDSSFSKESMVRLLRKGDFSNGMTSDEIESFKNQTLNEAIASAHTNFGGSNPIEVFHLKKKNAYKLKKLSDDLVVRKISLNLKKVIKKKPKSRSFLVGVLKNFLSEGVPYRVYRLDIKSFYESISIQELEKKLLQLEELSPLSKALLQNLSGYYSVLGGNGVPRGMAISAILSNYFMSSFDNHVFNLPFVYYYGRYVDDIVIVSNLKEDKGTFLAGLKENLAPLGLSLNNKKTDTKEASKKIKIVQHPKPPNSGTAHPNLLFAFEYLGYHFRVYDPVENSPEALGKFRITKIDIADSKLKKLKKRIIRSLLDFQRNPDEDLLIDRIKFLTSNFSIYDKNTGKKKMSGIYHSYPLLTANSESLAELDNFLRVAFLSKNGRLFSRTAPILDHKLKKKILSHSFSQGHTLKKFVYFTALRISQIQKCWKYD